MTAAHPTEAMPAPRAFWEELFVAKAGDGDVARVEMRAVSKLGQPFLLLPCRRHAARTVLSLYPAQTPRARAAKVVLSWLVRAGANLGTKPISLAISPHEAFAVFLTSLAAGARPGTGAATLASAGAGGPFTTRRRSDVAAPGDGRAQGLPTLGILAGNPASDGQRFLLLVFNASQEPVAVVKAGLNERARLLIQEEESFLAMVPPRTSGVPRLRATFQRPDLRALALDYFAGDSPRPRDEGALPVLLASWVDPQRTLVVADTPGWARLESAASASEWFAPLAGQLRNRAIHPAIQHGDMAPWNIKVSPAGAWTVLDWERGELVGIPGWDWFHYVIQPAILVEHLPAAELVRRVEGLLGSDAFKVYATRSGIIGCERELVLAYLLHAVEVIRPSEGLAATRDLLRALAARWRPG